MRVSLKSWHDDGDDDGAGTSVECNGTTNHRKQILYLNQTVQIFHSITPAYFERV